LTIGLKTCSLPLFPSEFLHLIFWLIIVLPKYISDISQNCPVGLLTLNILPFTMAPHSALSRSTRIGFFVMKTKSQHLESMFASFRRVACLFTIYSSGICMCTKGRRTGQVGGRRDLKCRLCLGPCRCIMTIVLMALTKWHIIGYIPSTGHLSGATDKTCRRGRNPVDVLRVMSIRRPRKISIIATYVLHILAVRFIGRLPSQPTFSEMSGRSIQDSMASLCFAKHDIPFGV
jgi:hypothetical protein